MSIFIDQFKNLIVLFLPQPEPGDIDLLNLATIYTVLNSGDVYPSSREDIPEAKPLAAIFRF